MRMQALPLYNYRECDQGKPCVWAWICHVLGLASVIFSAQGSAVQEK